jgi:methionyl-tRNA formyltransferase
MRIAFLGTPDFAVQALAELVAAGHEIAAVYSQPPAPRGRGQAVKPSPVHAFAEGLGLPVRTPASMRDPAEIEAFAALGLDAAVVVAFGQILPRAVLEAPRLGSFNLHGSLLPRWRGAAPIQRALMAGDACTGVQVMRMTEGLDEGPVLLSETVPIAFDDTAGTLHDKMARAGASLLPRALAALERGGARETPQPEEGVTYAKKIKPAEARIDWSRPRRRSRPPHPRAFALPRRLVRSARREGTGAGQGPDVPRQPRRWRAGEVLDDRLLIACGDGAVRLLSVQREGRAVQDAETFLRGYPLKPGAVLA